MRWRPVVDDLSVMAMPDGGAILDGSGIRRTRLDAALRRHVCALLLPGDWRQILEEAGVL